VFSSLLVRRLAAECGFELAGVAEAVPVPESRYYRVWVAAGMAGEMGYLKDKRADMRLDPRSLLPSARSVISVGKLYNTDQPYSTHAATDDRGWVSRYAWGDDYHDVLRSGLERLIGRLKAELEAPFDWKICVDTAPLLERAYARWAGLGWIGKNTCLINQGMGSWFFLGELLTSLEIAPDAPPPDRCGTCTRCIDACPTQAIVPVESGEGPGWALDSRRCISYFTIEHRGGIPEAFRAEVGAQVFGCDICQDVCPWNRKAAVTPEPAFGPHHMSPPLEELASLTEEEFRVRFLRTPVTRAKYAGFLRNVAVAMGNSGQAKFRDALERLAGSSDPEVAGHARWALERIELAAVRAP